MYFEKNTVAIFLVHMTRNIIIHIPGTISFNENRGRDSTACVAALCCGAIIEEAPFRAETRRG